ncbi:MAG: hypothetical protein ACREOO_17355 [bacterium]
MIYERRFPIADLRILKILNKVNRNHSDAFEQAKQLRAKPLKGLRQDNLMDGSASEYLPNRSAND